MGEKRIRCPYSQALSCWWCAVDTVPDSSRGMPLNLWRRFSMSGRGPTSNRGKRATFPGNTVGTAPDPPGVLRAPQAPMYGNNPDNSRRRITSVRVLCSLHHGLGQLLADPSGCPPTLPRIAQHQPGGRSSAVVRGLDGARIRAHWDALNPARIRHTAPRPS